MTRELYTLEHLRRMQEDDGHVEGEISVRWDETSDIDWLNDYASEQLTGDECALEDIDFQLVGVNLRDQEIILRVTGSVENWLKDLEEEEEQ